ncbi:MAG: OmpA family protein [Kiritimatiellae bacterium]|jgi:peptidoglycan-associated lipoprotein|nr:OmpA family protein [Kiritimatiellia bacterium]
MRTSFFLSLIAATALIFTGCATKSNGAGDGYGDDNAAAFAGDGASIDPNAAGFDPNDPNAGAFDNGKFEDTRTRVTDAGLEALYFSFDSYMLPPEELTKAEDAAQYLLENPTYVMIIEGHCDERGSNEYNLSLSEQRAIGVRDYMVSLGIDGNRIQTRAFGEDKPAVPGMDESSYTLNRRAEFVPYK